MADIKITGLEQIQKNLKLLPMEVRDKGAKFAGRKAANLIKKAAQANAMKIDDPLTAADIAKNIVVRYSPKVFKTTGNLVFRVGVLGGAKGFAKASGEVEGKGKANPGGDTYYWRFIEFGTSRTQARPFMQPAIRDNTQAATSEFSKQLDKWLTRRIKKLKKG
jgi:HK97 gp10 family phage protein